MRLQDQCVVYGFIAGQGAVTIAELLERPTPLQPVPVAVMEAPFASERGDLTTVPRQSDRWTTPSAGTRHNALVSTSGAVSGRNPLPPRPEAALADAWERDLERGGVAPHSCLYVSTPITTGPRLLDAALSGMGRDALIKKNVTHARSVVARLKSTASRVVLDPTTLDDVAGWDQPDYHAFWLHVLDRWVAEIAFCNGWAYSTGCCIEFTFAVDRGIPTLDEDLRPLKAKHVVNLLTQAADALDDAGRSSRYQRRALAMLEQGST